MTDQPSNFDIEAIVNDVLATIEKEREREIIARRYGLFDRRETLEQIGELLGITRERVRQLEKATVHKLAAAAEEDLPHGELIEASIKAELAEKGQAARISKLAELLTGKNDKITQSRMAFLAELTPNITFIEENDNYHAAASITPKKSDKAIKKYVDEIIAAIKKIGKPVSIKEIAGALGNSDPKNVEALASVSKQLATLNGRWGLIKWPMVNPKNIRDKIYVILYEHGKYMHFSEISNAIKDSEFKRKDVTTQAIHNELIKDKRFILVGRGIYALKEWGFKQGTVADVIVEIMKDAGEPLHRDEIVKRVLKKRFVKETTILLNLQGKKQFKRTAKATYTLAD
ncbi:MAG: hypothetical protein M3Q70_01430 [bacterium]|nr:hypothetical protein [bacterium]